MERPAHIAVAMGFSSLVATLSIPGLGAGELMLVWLVAGVAGVFPDNDVKFGVHRKTLHNVFALLLTTLLVSFATLYLGAGPRLSLLVGVSWASGMLSHLAVDSLTVYGVAWLYPLRGQTYGLRITRFNSLVWNKLFFLAGVAASVASALHVTGFAFGDQLDAALGWLRGLLP